MLAKILDADGHTLAEGVEVVLKVENRGIEGRFVSGYFVRPVGLPFQTGDKFLLRFQDKDAEESGVENPFTAFAFPKGDTVDFRPCRPDKW